MSALIRERRLCDGTPTAALRLESGASMSGGAFDISAPGGVVADLFQPRAGSGAPAMCFGPSFSCAGSTSAAPLGTGGVTASAAHVARTYILASDGTTWVAAGGNACPLLAIRTY